MLDKQQAEQEEATSSTRKKLIGKAFRNEKIRTYNFPQDRITDHRISSSFHGIQQVLDGGVDEIIEALGANERTSLLEQALT